MPNDASDDDTLAAVSAASVNDSSFFIICVFPFGQFYLHKHYTFSLAFCQECAIIKENRPEKRGDSYIFGKLFHCAFEKLCHFAANFAESFGFGDEGLDICYKACGEFVGFVLADVFLDE